MKTIVLASTSFESLCLLARELGNPYNSEKEWWERGFRSDLVYMARVSGGDYTLREGHQPDHRITNDSGTIHAGQWDGLAEAAIQSLTWNVAGCSSMFQARIEGDPDGPCWKLWFGGPDRDDDHPETGYLAWWFKCVDPHTVQVITLRRAQVSALLRSMKESEISAHAKDAFIFELGL